MGVRGLTTFIANRSRQYHESYELHDCYLVVDGNSIASQLYRWHCKCNDCFGGDYDKYANVIYTFLKLLQDCNVTPLVIFDGAYEKRKLKTVYSRMKNKISAAKDLNGVTEGSVAVFPLFLREIFVDILLKLGIKCARCDFEGDSEIAFLARNLQCPLLSYDSDFYIFDVLYIPFSSMELRLKKKKNYNYIACDVYSVDKFLNSFGGLDKINLPLLAVLLGNDYIKKSSFSRFYSQLKMQKTRENVQQRLIKSVIVWLKNETPDSALRKILGRYKIRRRKQLAKKIQMAIEGYQCTNSTIGSCFDIDITHKQEQNISVPNPEEIEAISEDDQDEDMDDNDEEEQEEENNDEDEDIDDNDEEKQENNEDQVDETLCDEAEDHPNDDEKLPRFFRENFKKCLYPSCFMDMIVSHTYYCIPQVEDSSLEHSHTISLDILGAIYNILTSPNRRKLMYVARVGRLGIKRYHLPRYEKKVPRLAELEHIDLITSRNILLDILNLQSDNMLISFPDSWHLFLLSIKYWVENSKSRVALPYIYSTVLCGIILNYIDSKIGFYRSTKSFLSKYNSPSDTNNTTRAPSCTKDITKSIEEIDSEDSVSCLKALIHYFQMDAKMKTNTRLFDRTIVHQFSQFQSCLLHIKYLNSLLNCPFPSLVISDFYDGTFLYNMTANLLKRTDLKSYMQILLMSSPKVLNVFNLMTEAIEEEIGEKLEQRDPPKKRRKKKKSKDVVLDEDCIGQQSEDEEYVLDSNNFYSLLSFVNK